MPQYALSAIGRDRPGIVAAVTHTLLEHDVNVEDSQMTILRGRFTMMLILEAPDGLDEAALRRELDAVRAGLELDGISLEPVSPGDGEGESEPSHIITVYGVDHPGIVEAVASALAEAGANITDLNTRLVSEDAGDTAGEAGGHLYAMMIEVALPPGLSELDLESALAETRRDQGVEVSIRELERDEL